MSSLINMFNTSTKESKLTNLIKEIDWVMVNPNFRNMVSGRNALTGLDDVTIAFARNKKKNIVNEIRIKLGLNVCEKLGWQPKDRICIFNHPDNMSIFLLVKSNSGAGYTLSKMKGALCYGLGFTWKNDFPLEEKPTTKVNFEMDDNKLVFEVK